MRTFHFEIQNMKYPSQSFTRNRYVNLVRSQIHAGMAEPLILVTGSTDGIGKATAARSCSGGAEVILHGRDEKKGQRVQRELAQMAGNGRPDLVIADFTRQDQIRGMAADLYIPLFPTRRPR